MFFALLALFFIGLASFAVYKHYQKQQATLSKISQYEPFHIDTPVIESTWLSKHVGTKVHLKMDALQPSGSFKIRGIGHLIQRVVNGDIDPPNVDDTNNDSKKQEEIDPIYDDTPYNMANNNNNNKRNKITHLVSSSGANAGMAVAYVAYKMNIECTIFLSDTKQDHGNKLISKFEQFGSNIKFIGNNWNECDAAARLFAKNNKHVAYIPMFDHECIFRGHSTIITELKAVNKLQPDCIVVSTGGGGLLSGIALGLLQTGWQHGTTVVSAQGENCHLFDSAINNNMKPIGVQTIDSEGNDLGIRSVCQKSMFWAERFSFFENSIKSIVVKDKIILKMCIEFANQHHVMIEPLCATAIAAVYDNKEYFKQFENICIIVCGGNHCHVESFNDWKKRIKRLSQDTNLLRLPQDGNVRLLDVVDSSSYGVASRPISGGDDDDDDDESSDDDDNENDQNGNGNDSDDSVRESVSFSN